MSASAGSAGYAFDSTDVMEDLNSSELNGDKFNVVKYPFRSGQQPSILNFVEFGYSFRANMRDNYALYLYVYNPGALRIKETAEQNKVQMAVAYDADGNPSRYEKFSLVFCSASTGDYKGLFYKFRIADRKIDGKSLAERVLSGERRYDVSGFELVSGNNRNATEYKVGGSYRFTGYATGLGPDKDAPDTLTCHVTELETLALDVRHTYFRTNVSSLGKDHYNEVNTVWFSVPEYIYEEYGYLQKIRAEWWEYKTKYMTVTSNKAFYDALLPYVGTDVGDYSSSVPVSLGYGYLGKNTAGGPTIHRFAWTYNMDTSTRYNALGAITAVYYVDEKQSIMPYAFYAPVSDVSSVFDFLSSGSVAGGVSGTVLADWIYNYKNSLGHGYIDCNGRKISRDLFLDRVDDGRTMGYNDRTIDLKDTFDLKSYDSNHGCFFWTVFKGEFTVSRNQRIGTDRDPAFMGDGYCDLILLMVDVDEIELYERFTVKDLELVKEVRTVIAFDLSPFFDPDGILGFAFHFSFLLLCFSFCLSAALEKHRGEAYLPRLGGARKEVEGLNKKQSGVSDRQYVVQ